MNRIVVYVATLLMQVLVCTDREAVASENGGSDLASQERMRLQALTARVIDDTV